jgi:hypothetical protein
MFKAYYYATQSPMSKAYLWTFPRQRKKHQSLVPFSPCRTHLLTCAVDEFDFAEFVQLRGGYKQLLQVLNGQLAPEVLLAVAKILPRWEIAGIGVAE